MNSEIFSIANFKSFSDLSEIRIKPITLIFGPNSAGKSSIIQGLDLLSNLAGSSKNKKQFSRHDLESFINNKASNLLLGLSSGHSLSKETASISVMFLTTKSHLLENCTSTVQIRFNDEIVACFRDFEPSLMHATLLKIGDQIFDELFKKFAEKIGINTKSIPDFVDFKSFSQDYIDWMVDHNYVYLENFPTKPEIYSVCDDDYITMKGLSESIGATIIDRATTLIGPENLSIFHDFINKELIPYYSDIVASSCKNVREYLSSIYHIPPLREIPSRRHDPMSESASIWSRLFANEMTAIRINNWLSSEFMRSKYQLYKREFIEVDKSQNSSFGVGFYLFLTTGKILDYSQKLIKKIRKEYESLDILNYIKSNEELDKKILSDMGFAKKSYDFLAGLSASIEQIIKLPEYKNNPNDYFGQFPDSYHSKKHHKNLNNLPTIDNKDSISKLEEIVFKNLKHNKFHYPEVWLHFFNNKLSEDEMLQSFLTKIENTYEDSFASNLKRRYEIGLYDQVNDCDVSLSDVGVGISQVIPVLLSAYGCEKSIVSIEQPEIHIHPAMQSELADVFIESALGENQNSFLLETHSEHLILRILRRIRETTEEDFSEWPEALKKACPQGIRPADVAVLYVEPGEEGSTLRNLRINELGEFIDEWPNGFFEERIREIF